MKNQASLLPMDPASSLAIGGWFVQVVFDKILTAVIQHWGVVPDIPDLPGALKRLQTVMNTVRTLLSLAQNFKRENEGFLESLNDLIDAAYDAEDLISEVDYYRLELQGTPEKTDSRNIVRSFVRATKASTSSTPPSSHHSDKATLVARIDQIVARLKDIVKDVRGVLLLLHPVEANPNVIPVASHRITTSLWSSNQTVYGRDNERDAIVEKLLSAEPEYVSLIPIVGMGGVGKTTLASTVFNHQRVKKHFDCSMWIYVSHSFDVARLTREMLQELKVDGFHHITNLNTLQVLLEEKLQSVRFLLVLDDVWNESEMEQWSMFCAPLRSGKAGSRVLMTTRLVPVASIMGEVKIMDPIKLEPLRDEEFLSLFYKCAFGRDEDPELADAELLETGRQIACNLSGSPLAAKTVGGLLRKNLDIRYWRSILSSEIWQLPQNQGDIIHVLNLSYQHLPAHLQRCFAFCSLFPKGLHFGKDELVAMWISHGYIQTRGSKTLEDIGSVYFDDLVSRSFFQTGECTKEMFVVPNLMHDLAMSVSKDECLRINGNMPNAIPTRTRHLFAHSSDLIHLKGTNLRNLRTLVIYPDGDIAHDNSVFQDVINGLKSIRVLVFHPSVQSLPDNVSQLIHLRYLKLVISHHITQIQVPVPDSWCKLCHLQWMIFLGNSGLLSLPISMNDLVNLRRFFGDGRKFGMMVGIGKLTCLQELESFSIGNVEGRMLGELKMLKELGGSLKICDLENITTKDQALEAELNKKRRIQELQLHCEVSHVSPEVAEQVFEALSPPAYIRRLVIDGYGGVKSPIWMVPGNLCVSYLQSLCLSRCLKWKDLPSLGQLRLLRNLEICGADAVEEIGMGFYGTGDAQRFPRLETLVIKCMPQLTVWSGVEDHQLPLFPHLRTLTVMGCPRLGLPPMEELASLEELETDHMRLLTVLENLRCLKTLKISGCHELLSLPLLPASLVELKISHCHQLLTLFNTELEETLSILTSLVMLSFQDCPRFTLPSVELKNPPFLKKLIIEGCDNVRSVTLLPDTLEEMEIS